MSNYLQKSWWHLFVVAFAMYLAYKYVGFSKNTSDTKNEGSESRTAKDIKNAILKQKERIVGKFCPDGSSEKCSIIVDRPFLENKNLVVKRHFKIKNAPEISVTVAELETPQDLTWKNFNTRHWSVNKLVVSSLYSRMMIAMGFVMQALDFDPIQWQDVLMIGLGGGGVTNFLSAVDFIMINATTVELDPSVVEVAREWFGLTESDTNTVLIEDGVVFVHNAVKKGEKYKSIMLDACFNEKKPVICPIPAFTKSSVIQDLADLLDDEGVLTVNVLCLRDAIGTEDELLVTYKEHFPTCFLLRYNPNQRLLVCSNKENWSFEEQRARFMENAREVDDRFDFDITPIFSSQQ